MQVVTRERRDVVDVDHVGLAHTDAELDLMLLAPDDRLRPGQEAMDLGPLERVGTRVSDVADCTEGAQAPLPVEPESGGRG